MDVMMKNGLLNDAKSLLYRQNSNILVKNGL